MGKQALSNEIVASRNDDKDCAQGSGKSIGKSQQKQLMAEVQAEAARRAKQVMDSPFP